MPGIAGIINKKPLQLNESTLELMVEAMRHEDFYSSGKYLNDHLGVYVGWVVHKDSFADCLPIYNETKDIILIFYGENYVDSDILQKLKNKNHEVFAWNASYLIHLYEDDEQSFFKILNGWFNGVLIDLRQKKPFFLMIDMECKGYISTKIRILFILHLKLNAY